MRRKAAPVVFNVAFGAFILTEAGIYIAFNVMAALNSPDPIYLKYAGVLLCLAAAICSLFFIGGRDSIFIACAMAFTAVSDWFILVKDDNFEIGLATFIVAQSIYLARLYGSRYKKLLPTVTVRAALIAILFVVFCLKFEMSLLLGECIVYAAMLACNVADAFVLCKRGFKDILFAVGLLLFLCCDICVGLHNFGSVLNVSLPKGAVSFANVAMWAFYLPSQVCIVCSIKGKNKGVKKDESRSENS